MKNLLYIILVSTFFSCVNTQIPVRTDLMSEARKPLSDTAELMLVSQYERLPEGSQFISKVEAGGAFNQLIPCDYELVMDEIERNARGVGANIIRVIRPTTGRFCPRITVGLYRNDNVAALADLGKKRARLNASTLPENADYALVHFYRTQVGSAFYGARIFHEGEKVGSLGENRGLTYRITDFGRQRFTVGRNPDWVELEVVPGQEYYLVFSPRTDVFDHLRMELRLVDNLVGREESKTVDFREQHRLSTDR